MPVSKYPDNLDGDVFRRMEASGDDLSKPRNVDFEFIFASKEQAQKFSDKVHTTTGLKAEATRYDEGQMWESTVTKFMIPTYSGITKLEDSLARVA
jgi:hypothetical protein